MNTVIKLVCNVPCIYKFNNEIISSDVVAFSEPTFVLSVLPLDSAIPIFAKFSIKGGLDCSHSNVSITKLAQFKYIASFALDTVNTKLSVLSDEVKLKTAEHSLHYTSHPFSQIQIECHEAYLSLSLNCNESYIGCTPLNGETFAVDTNTRLWIITFTDGDYKVLNILEKTHFKIDDGKIFITNNPKTICKLNIEKEYSPEDNYKNSSVLNTYMGIKYNYTDKTVGVHLLECIMYGAYPLISALVDLSFSGDIVVTSEELKNAVQERCGKAKKGERTKEESERSADETLRLLKGKKLYYRLKEFFGDFDEILYYEDKILLKEKTSSNRFECKEFSFTVINKIIVDIIEM